MSLLMEAQARQAIAKIEASLRISVIDKDLSVVDRVIKLVNPRLRYKVQKRITEMRQAAGVTINWFEAYAE